MKPQKDNIKLNIWCKNDGRYKFLLFEDINLTKILLSSIYLGVVSLYGIRIV